MMNLLLTLILLFAPAVEEPCNCPWPNYAGTFPESCGGCWTTGYEPMPNMACINACIVKYQQAFHQACDTYCAARAAAFSQFESDTADADEAYKLCLHIGHPPGDCEAELNARLDQISADLTAQLDAADAAVFAAQVVAAAELSECGKTCCLECNPNF